jgi:hypothetical protein
MTEPTLTADLLTSIRTPASDDAHDEIKRLLWHLMEIRYCGPKGPIHAPQTF